MSQSGLESAYSAEAAYTAAGDTLLLDLLAAGTPDGPWVAVATNEVQAAWPARFFRLSARWKP